MKKFTILFLALCATCFVISSSYAHQSNSPAMDIETFVKQTFFHGVDVEAALAYGADDIPALLEMLNNSDEERYWANIAVTLSIIGDDRALKGIIEFIERAPSGTLSKDRAERLHIAQTSALMGLGYMINRTGSKKALAYLAKGLSPETWNANSVQSINSTHSTDSTRGIDMSKYAVLGLALSGTESAAKVLINFQNAPPSGQSATFLTQNNAQNYELISEALQENQRIGQIGIINYDRQIKQD